MPECWPAVRVFLAAATQWRYAGLRAVPVGLDYAGVEAVMRMIQVPASVDLFEDLSIMEAAALAAFAARRLK